MMNKKRKAFIGILCFMLVLTLCSALSIKTNAKTVKLNKKVYKEVKGWWTNWSSGGNDIKFGKSKMVVYRRGTKKVITSSKYYGVKKNKKGYLIKVKSGKYKICYIYNKKYPNQMDFFGDWKGKNHYSGSSSLDRGRWTY